MITISEAMAAYSICARAEGKSPQTMDWILSSMRYFMGFLGGDRELATISADDLRRFILEMQGRRHGLRTLDALRVIVGDLRAFPGLLKDFI